MRNVMQPRRGNRAERAMRNSAYQVARCRNFKPCEGWRAAASRPRSAAFGSFRTYVGLYVDAVVLPLQTYLPTRLRQPWARLRTYLPTSGFLRRGNTSAHSSARAPTRPDLPAHRCAAAYSTWLGKPRLLCPCSTQWLACHRTLSVQLPRITAPPTAPGQAAPDLPTYPPTSGWP